MVAAVCLAAQLSLYRSNEEVNSALGGSILLVLVEKSVGGALGLGLAFVQAGANGGKQILTGLANVRMGMEQAALENIGAVAQRAGALANLGAALGLALLVFLALFADLVL